MQPTHIRYHSGMPAAMPTASQNRQRRTASAAFWLSLIVVGWILAITAWICDDAFITFRSIEQLMDGNGPRWNPHERVQAFTHPLWFFAVALVRAVVGDPALAAKLLSWALAMTAFWLLARAARTSVGRTSTDRVLLALAAVVASRAFVDFSSSGLEDPLSHALLVVFALTLLGRLSNPLRASLERVQCAAWPAGLLLLCRPDNLWLVAPPMLWLLWKTWRVDGRRLGETLWAAIPGFVPLALWTLFSLVYYGFPFPNTAYAKLNTGVAGHDLWQHGVQYLTHTLTWDPATMAVLLVGAWLWLRAGRMGAAVAFGMALHLLYVVRIGGDFMAGRFLTESFVLGLCALALLSRPSVIRPALAVTAAFVVFWPHSPFGITDAYRSYHPDEHHGIADERAFYSGRNSYQGFERRWPIALWRSQASPQENFEVGFSAYSSGTDAIVIDRFALADPLLARLPADDGWTRIGHFRRSVPAGYAESLRRGTNEIENPFVHGLYDDLRLVTQGPLWTAERWGAIWRLNVLYQRPGCLDPPCRKLVTHLLPPQLYRSLLPVVDSADGGFEVVGPHPLAPSAGRPSPNLGEGGPRHASMILVEGRVPFLLLEQDQLVRVILPAHPVEDSLVDLSGRGFRAELKFENERSAQLAASSLCVAVAAKGGSWRLLPRLDSGGAVCSQLAEP